LTSVHCKQHCMNFVCFEQLCFYNALTSKNQITWNADTNTKSFLLIIMEHCYLFCSQWHIITSSKKRAGNERIGRWALNRWYCQSSKQYVYDSLSLVHMASIIIIPKSYKKWEIFHFLWLWLPVWLWHWNQTCEPGLVVIKIMIMTPCEPDLKRLKWCVMIVWCL